MYLIVVSLLLSFNLYAQEFLEGDYYNFKITKSLKNQLETNDTIKLSVHNPTKKKKEFYLVFEDKYSSDYWSKLNFKTTLFPGNNKISFNLKRNVGERGSIKYNRGINYKELTKMFVVVNPDKHKNNKYHLKKIGYSKDNNLKLPKDTFLFKFQSSKIKQYPINIFKTITEKDTYKKRKGFGFNSIDVWQMRDSKIAPFYLSNTISVKKAIFRVLLPPGEYSYELIWDELGYWDVPFWSNRRLKINNKTVHIDNRSTKEFLHDLFQFSKEPKAVDHPYNIYFEKIYKPLKLSFINKGEYVDFEFTGDASAVSLNTLMIWKKNVDLSIKKFKKELHKYSKLKFNQQYREKTAPKTKSKKLALSHIKINENFNNKMFCENKDGINLVTANNGQKDINICISSNSNSNIQLSLSNLVNGKSIISKDAFLIRKFNYDYESIDINHETYALKASKLVDSNNSLALGSFRTRYYNIKLLGGAYKSGTYKGTITLKQKINILKKEFQISIINTKLPDTSMNMGVLGLDPFPNTYFNSPQINILKERSMNDSLDLLQEIGLNLFTDMPTPYVSYKKPTYESFVLKSDKSKRFLDKAKSNEIFLYNSNFPKMFFEDNERNASQTQSEYFHNMQKELEKFHLNSKKKFIYLYSDEATGYRDAVNDDIAIAKLYKKKFPSLLLGGFGNLYDWEKGKELYKQWSYGLYSDIPSNKLFRKVKRSNKHVGVYNLCANRTYDLSFCFGIQMYRLYKNGIKHYLEWHAAAIHNYPGLDLDGREADIGLFYAKENGEVGITKRYLQAANGIETFKKLVLLDEYLKKTKSKNIKVLQATKWLKSLEVPKLFPISEYYEQNHSNNAKYQNELDNYLKIFFIL